MKNPFRKGTALRAWTASLPLALGLPAIGWAVRSAIFETNPTARSHIEALGWMIAISTVIHFVCYLITGLPLFLYRYHKVRSPLWEPIVGIPLGIVLGAMVPLMFYINGDARQSWELYAIVAAYGAVTAIAALRQRPTLE